MKLSKKELKTIAEDYNTAEGNNDIELLQGMKNILQITGNLQAVKNEAYKIRQNISKRNVITNMETIVNKYFKHDFNIDKLLNGFYADEIDFIEVPEDVKTAIKASTNYILNF